MYSCCAFKIYTINEKWHIFGNNSTVIKLKEMTLRSEMCNIPFVAQELNFYITSAVKFHLVEL